MNEEPKSIWKKSLKLPGLLSAWLAAMLATIFIFVLVMMVRNEAFDVPGLLVLGAVCATVLLALWAAVRWLFCWRNLKRTLFVLACFATLVALFYAEENWRGKRAWENYKHEWEAKGERFDLASVVPVPVPTEQNFAMTPIAYSSYGYILTRDGKRVPNEQRDTNFVMRMNLSITHGWTTPTNSNVSWRKGEFIRLVDWQNYYRGLAETNEFPISPQPQTPAADVLLALSKGTAVLDELRLASALPASRFPLNYDSESPGAILLPQLAALKGCAQVLQLRSLAELQNTHPDKAFADVLLGLQLTGKIQTEPFLISHLVRISMVQLQLQTVWEGLVNRAWSDKQLGEFEKELSGYNFCADYQLSMRGEMAMLCGETENLRRHPELLQRMTGYGDYGEDGEAQRKESSSPGSLMSRLIPSGWFYQNQLLCAQLIMKHFLPVADVAEKTFSPERVRRGNAAVNDAIKKTTPYNLIARMLLPAPSAAAKRFSYAESFVDMSRTAIALERYRLVRGGFPESLDALAPQFIAQVPHDVIGGQPLKYRRTSDGQFVLYSIGWNEKDDGGAVVLRQGSTPDVDIGQGDWVWRYPAK